MAPWALRMTTIKAAYSTYAVFTTIGVLLGSLWIVAFIVRPPPLSEGAKIMGIFLCYFALVYTWLSRFRVQITHDALSYRSLFSGTRVLRMEEIEVANVVVGKYGPGEAFKPYFRLELMPRQGVSRPPITINLKVFSRNDMRRILESVKTKMPERGRQKETL
jgi:hypothetical protein